MCTQQIRLYSINKGQRRRGLFPLFDGVRADGMLVRGAVVVEHKKKYKGESIRLYYTFVRIAV